MTSGPDGFRAFPPHQVYGFSRARAPVRFLGMQVLPFMPSLECYLRNSLLSVARFVTWLSVYFNFAVQRPEPAQPSGQGPDVSGPCLPARAG